MRYIKTYENYEIEDGDFVIINPSNEYTPRYNHFLSTHIARIFELVGGFIYVHFEFNDNDSEEVYNEYDHVHPFKISEIKQSSKDKQQLKLELDAEKYNL